ncbi:hypothetical protein EDD80_101587 [Anseongella ginsenosidimutans]|uniref:Acyl carrier protein phosphodiesterase n=1 Tax=Anseongella ginsenosidimutans TaxID=496056 RepID=A0A4R3KX38_9SPHI|nr:hypothetical protein [Anseongella ginsenosidimutans]QEC50968.1 hypothetical protein FRZ59_00435 [Anseongella ginsenosidimutans]TCS90387.1 hypothetical protein EDD80_101587 [Anseongella ginsenosidimutans]
MNFLSHFYLIQDNPDPYLVLGMVLPDMVKNHRKTWNLHPYKQAGQLEEDAVLRSIYRGWELHLETDRRFHSSSFFSLHSVELRKQIAAVLSGPPFRPFFLAHIALELLLDSLLIIQQRVDIGKFYLRLSACGEQDIVRFLEINGIHEAPSFTGWFRQFTRSAYLYSYSSPGNLSHALDSIGRRVWQVPFPEEKKGQLAVILQAYRNEIENDYLPIFEEITYYLRPL